MNSPKTIQKRWVIVATGFMLVAIVFIYFYLFSPFENDNFFMPCYFKGVTGYECVGCGAQRSVHELLHFRFLRAFHYNPFFVLMIPLLAYYIFHSLKRYVYGIPTPDTFWYTWKFGKVFIVMVLLFLVLRNVI